MEEQNTRPAPAPSPAPRRNSNQRSRTSRRKKRCPLLEAKIDYIDYKDTRMLERFLGDNKRILPRRLTGVNTTMQRRLATAIKRAKQIALLPYV
jgi:small subunit ribosomal protein S18